MTEADGAFRTDDMTLAVVLSLRGFKYRTESMTGFQRKRVSWVFECSGKAAVTLRSIVDKYSSEEYRVEPRAFVMRMAQVREEMYRLIGTQDRRHARSAPSAQNV